MRSVLLALCLLAAASASATTFNVVNDADSGAGSLRQAILDANGSPGRDEIISDWRIEIRPLSSLPVITDSVLMRSVTLDGSSAGAADGLVFTSSENDVHGLEVRNFAGNGVVFRGGGKNLMGEFSISMNGGNGLVFENSTDNKGGVLWDPHNNSRSTGQFFGNGGYGILITGGSARIDLYTASLGRPIGNGKAGLRAVDASELKLDSLSSATNGGNGIELLNVTQSSLSNLRTGRAIGLAGNGNQGYGIWIDGGSNISVTMRSTADAKGGIRAANVSELQIDARVAGSAGNAIEVVNVTKGSIVNFTIGLDELNHPLGNDGHGIFIEGGSDISVTNGQVTHCGGDGMRVLHSPRVKVSNFDSRENGGNGLALFGASDGVLEAVQSFRMTLAYNGANGLLLADGCIRNQMSRISSFSNHEAGVRIENSAQNTLAGSSVYLNGVGIVITGSPSVGNAIRSSAIGFDDDYSGSNGNKGDGIRIADGASGNVLGTDAEGNSIVQNGGVGIRIESGSGNSVNGSTFEANGGLPIDLEGDGETFNDLADADSGANGLQNYPTVAMAYHANPGVVDGVLNARPSSTYSIGVYSAFHDLRRGEGFHPSDLFMWRGTVTVTTDARGTASFQTPYVTGTWVAMTATDSSGNTSEMGRAIPVREPGHFVLSAGKSSVNEGAGAAVIEVQRLGPPDWPASIGYRTINATAIAGADYQQVTGTLVFQPGESVKTFSVPILKDALAEADETFIVEIQNPTDGLLILPAEADFLWSRATVTIVDRRPALSVGDVAVDEGDGVSAVTFAVSIDTMSGESVTFDYHTVAQSAKEGEDFQAISGHATIAAGQSQVLISIRLRGDLDQEGDETFGLALSNAGNATIARDRGTAILRNDDGVPEVTAADVEIQELQDAEIRLKRTKLNRRPTQLNYRTVAGTATSADFVATEGSVTLGIDATENVIRISTQSDSASERNETFYVELFEPDNAVFPRERIAVTIRDDGDTAVVPEIEETRFVEGNEPHAAELVVKLSRPLDTPATFSYKATGDGATNGVDLDLPAGSLTFAAGETVKTIPFRILGDAVLEDNEPAYVRFDGAGSSDARFFIDDDDGPSLSISDGRIALIDPALDVPVFVTLDAPAVKNVFFEYEIHPGTLRSDNLAIHLNNVTQGMIAAGQTRVQLDPVLRYYLASPLRPDTYFRITLTHASFAKIARAESRITFLDQDRSPGQPLLFARDLHVEEPVNGIAHANFVVELAPSHEGWVSVEVQTTAGTATGADFTGASQRLMFAPGETRKTVAVDIVADGLDEEPEWFFLVLRNAINANVGRDIGVATIYDPGENRRHRSAGH